MKNIKTPNKFRVGQKVGCHGEGDSIYKIDLIDNKMNCAYLEAFGNTSVDVGWKSFSKIKKIEKIKKSSVVVYNVKFVETQK